jgi:hypothetical protein
MEIVIQAPPKEEAVQTFATQSEAGLLEAWSKQIDPNSIETRDALIEAMRRKQVYPSSWSADRERKAGLYPDIMDPEFATRLYTKTEFSDLRSTTVSEDTCGATTAAFDTTAVQQLVARFLHPSTPYRGLLLDHGVGVGKTCSAISVAEMFLESMPSQRVIILCPQAIASGFRRTIFDPDRLIPLAPRLAQLRGESWESPQCTGMTYLRLAGNGNEKDRSVIEKDAEQLIRKRYRIMGYLQFANWVLKKLAELPKTLEAEARKDAEDRILHTLFSDCLLIIDEAHNLRDIEGSAAIQVREEGAEESPIQRAAVDAAEGKKLTPVLRRILGVSEGLRLMLMTATPMYNTAPEILFLLNLLLLNDVKDEGKLLKPRDFFTGDGALIESSHATLQRICSRYISYMRGENPASFPLRLTPEEAAKDALFEEYPTLSISRREDKVTWTPAIRKILSMLPMVVHTPHIEKTVVGKALHKVLSSSRKEMEEDEVPDFVLDQATQTSNIAYPNGTYGSNGWDTHFQERQGRTRQFTWNTEMDIGVEDVFGKGALASHSPKIAAIVESVGKAKGMCFVFSRYVKAGALPIAVSLECAGWTRVLSDGSTAPILVGMSVPRACAFCSSREGEAHEGHTFAPAHFVLLTGDDTLTPDFKGTLAYANTLRNEFEIRGGKVKVILGSQITAEGLDLKCIRENHLLDGWYHLNRVEQVIGRAVRFCSHAMLPKEEQNCTIYLHVNKIPEYETADLYAYRLAARKAIPIGQVQRIIKISAWDCLMNRDAVMLRGLQRRKVLTSQGRTLVVDPKDKPYTSICDFMESCEYSCGAKEAGEPNLGTYQPEDARRRLKAREEFLRAWFRKEVALSIPALQQMYSDLPWDIASMGIRNLLDNPRFVVEREDGVRGTLHYQHGYLVFQPLGVTDYDIPMAMRFGRAFGRIPRFMELPRDTLLATERPQEEEVHAEVPGEVSIARTAVTDDLYMIAIQSLRDWLDHLKTRIFPTAMAVAIAPPTGVPAGAFFEGWRWVYHRFQTLNGIQQVAEHWWMDHEWTLEQRMAVLSHWTVHGPEEAEHGIAKSLQPVEYFRGAISGFHTPNLVPKAKQKVVVHCFFDGDAEPTVCPSNLLQDVAEIVGPIPDKVKDTGPVFGFLAFNAKEQNVLFKTINKADGSWKGAQCFNTSNLPNHRERLALVQKQIREHVPEDHPILSLLLDDSEETRPSEEEARKRGKTGTLLHLHDLAQKQICPYMEFLLRWMESQHLGGKRWFLSLIDSLRIL